MPRNHLPDRRSSVTQKMFVDGKQKVHLTVGLYPDGRPGEIWIDISKQGQALRMWANAAAMLASMLLQYDAPLEEVVAAFKDTDTELCAVGEWLEREFLMGTGTCSTPR